MFPFDFFLSLRETLCGVKWGATVVFRAQFLCLSSMDISLSLSVSCSWFWVMSSPLRPDDLISISSESRNISYLSSGFWNQESQLHCRKLKPLNCCATNMHHYYIHYSYLHYTDKGAGVQRVWGIFLFLLPTSSVTLGRWRILSEDPFPYLWNEGHNRV